MKPRRIGYTHDGTPWLEPESHADYRAFRERNPLALDTTHSADLRERVAGHERLRAIMQTTDDSLSVQRREAAAHCARSKPSLGYKPMRQPPLTKRQLRSCIAMHEALPEERSRFYLDHAHRRLNNGDYLED